MKSMNASVSVTNLKWFIAALELKAFLVLIAS